MLCPRCAEPKMRAIYTIDTGPIIKRTRRCVKCGFSIETVEKPIFDNTMDKEEIREYEEYISKELTTSKK